MTGERRTEAVHREYDAARMLTWATINRNRPPEAPRSCPTLTAEMVQARGQRNDGKQANTNGKAAMWDREEVIC